jgi:acyl dehydratase
METGQKATYLKSFTQEDYDRFAAISGDNNPIHVDPAFSARTKFGKTVAHGMLLYSTIGRCLGEYLPGPGTLQISQELMFPNPTFVGQEITLELEVSALPSQDTAEMITNITHANGKYGCTGKTVVWVPGASIDFVKISFKEPDLQSEVEEHRGLKIGKSAGKTRIFSHADVLEYIDLVNETNPIFTDQAYAKRSGFRDILIPGGLLGGLVSDILGTRLPGRGTNWLKQRFIFLHPAYPGDEIHASVEITRLRPEKDLVNLRTTLTNQENKTIVDGEALVWISDLEEMT